MGSLSIQRISPAAQPPAGFTVPTFPTVADLARQIDAVERAICRLPDDRFDEGQVPLVDERGRLVSTLAGTGLAPWQTSGPSCGSRPGIWSPGRCETSTASTRGDPGVPPPAGRAQRKG